MAGKLISVRGVVERRGGPAGLLWRGEGSREPPTDLGALVGVLTEERDDEERQTTTPSVSGGYGGYGGDGGDTLEITRLHQDQTASKPRRRHPKAG
jgi:hypothetical protein